MKHKLTYLPYSSPDSCRPRLEYFRKLTAAPPEDDLDLPKDDAVADGNYRVLGLDPPETDRVVVHVYKTTAEPLKACVYGRYEGGKARLLGRCVEIGPIAYRLPVKVDRDGLISLAVRFSIPGDLAEGGKGYVALAAYDGKEPASAGGVRRVRRPACNDPYRQDREEVETEYIPFDCAGEAFQRLVFSSCSPKDDLRKWADASGLETAETYFGEAGSVIVVGVPPGLDLNTTGGSAKVMRDTPHSGDGTVNPDYLVNLINPKKPATRGRGGARNLGENGKGKRGIDPRSYLGELGVSDACDPQKTDRNLEPLRVTVIDSGADTDVNRHLWEDTAYRQRKRTEYIRPWHLGYDFIRHDYEPEDENGHGTYVAAILQAQYRAARPLEVIHMKTFGPGGISSFFGALVSIYEAIAVGSRVIHTSWGIYGQEAPEALTCAVRAAARRGIFLVASAGNDHEDLNKEAQWPAAYAEGMSEHVLTVASYWYEDFYPTADAEKLRRAPFSNYGAGRVSLAAFLTAGAPRIGTGEPYFPTGTSFSAPIVTGLLLDWLADNPRGTLAEFRDTYCHHSPKLEPEITGGWYLPLDHSRVLLT
ncbi:S8 family serine peptidase [Lewinella sp. IMCC34183]|uniref:S8 family serine peptidase n=1 Tax=Lewinella sp. IMCC34183 TaxID=2248762 RepID=UPI000E280E2A|nr:S8 family serine peptidase [Lewinella sp. IMCC34183]